MPATVATVNTSDRVLIPDARNYMHARAPIGNDWTEVALGMFFTLVPAANDDAAAVAETHATGGYADWFCFGLKDGSTALPGATGAVFAGHCFSGDSSSAVSCGANSSGSGYITAANARYHVSAISNGSILGSQTAGASSTTFGFPIWSAGNCHAFVGLKFAITNRGLSNQQITIYRSNDATAQSDVSRPALRNKMFGVTYGSSGALAFASGGVALPLPEYAFLRLPLVNNRIRISCIDCVRLR